MLLGLLSPDAGMAQIDSLTDMSALDSLLNVTISAASKYDQNVREAPASITIISREDIQRYGYVDIAEALAQVRDLYTSYDRNYVYVGMRGFSRPTDYNNRIAVLLNGSPLNENIWGGGPTNELSGIPIQDLERIEVIQGPASSLYGSSPMLGIINIVTHSHATLDHVQVAASGGSFGRYGLNLAASTELAKAWDLNIGLRYGGQKGQQLYYPEYDDSSTNFGVADFRNWQRFGGFSAKVSHLGFSAQAMLSRLVVGVPTGAYGTYFNGNNYNTTEFGLLEARYSRDLRHNLALHTRIALNHIYYQSNYPLDDTEQASIDDGATGRYLSTEARLQWDTHSNNRMVFGVEFVRHVQAYFFQDTIPGSFFQSNTPYSTYGVFFQDEYQLSKRVILTAGARVDRLYQQLQAFSPRASINFFPTPGTTIKAHYGRAFRSPTVYEFNIDDGYLFKGNPGLTAERIHTFELNIEQRINDHIVGRASAYHMTMTDLIDQVLDPLDGLTQFQNVATARGKGLSAELLFRYGSRLSAYTNHSLQNIRSQEGDALTNAPRQLWKAGLALAFARHFHIAPEIQYRDRVLNVQNSYTPAFWLLNANLAFEPDFRGKAAWANRLRLNLRARNLLNSSYGFPGGFEHRQATILQDGRNVDVLLSVDLF